MGEWLTKQKAVRDAKFPECPWVFFWHTADCVLGHGGVRTKPGSRVEKFDASCRPPVCRNCRPAEWNRGRTARRRHSWVDLFQWGALSTGYRMPFAARTSRITKRSWEETRGSTP